MTFEDRKKIATEIVVEFLESYAPPRGLSETNLAKRISEIADAFARKMPVGPDYAEKVESVLIQVRDSHLSNSWPPQAAFVGVMPKTEFRGTAPATFRPKEHGSWVGQQMCAGQSVPEVEIWKSPDVDREVLSRYRYASVSNWQSVYGKEAEGLMVDKYGSTVRQYFLEAAE